MLLTQFVEKLTQRPSETLEATITEEGSGWEAENLKKPHYKNKT